MSPRRSMRTFETNQPTNNRSGRLSAATMGMAVLLLASCGKAAESPADTSAATTTAPVAAETTTTFNDLDSGGIVAGEPTPENLDPSPKSLEGIGCQTPEEAYAALGGEASLGYPFTLPSGAEFGTYCDKDTHGWFFTPENLDQYSWTLNQELLRPLDFDPSYGELTPDLQVPTSVRHPEFEDALAIDDLQYGDKFNIVFPDGSLGEELTFLEALIHFPEEGDAVVVITARFDGEPDLDTAAIEASSVGILPLEDGRWTAQYITRAEESTAEVEEAPQTA